MKIAKISGVIFAVVTIMACMLVTPFMLTADAAAGTVYTCTLNRCYEHPVTKIIEDSGGRASFATGQGMVEGCTSDFAVMEETDSGNFYLTIRMSLMDYTSGHSFQVQKWGDTAWQDTAAGITGNGSDTNGTTADICIQVPSENSIVRGTMYVEPMGRWVIWYMYPSDFKEGNSTDMNTVMVTAPSAKNQPSESVESSIPESSAEESSIQESSAPESSAPESSIQESSQESSKEESSKSESSVQESAKEESSVPESSVEESSEISMIPLPSTAEKSNAEVPMPQISHDESYTFDNTRGLALSTEKEVSLAESDSAAENPSNDDTFTWIVIGCISVLAVIFCIVLILVKNKNKAKLNTEDDHEEYDEDGEDDE